MILKPIVAVPLPTDPRLRAGVHAERQMAHYLHRAFATSSNLYVINDLRLVDPEQPEPDPRTGEVALASPRSTTSCCTDTWPSSSRARA